MLEGYANGCAVSASLGSRSGVWTDTVQVPVGRDQPHGRDECVGRLLVIDETEMPTSVCTLIPSLLKGDELVAQVDECHRITLGGDKASAP